jgi:hypothetical protein
MIAKFFLGAATAAAAISTAAPTSAGPENPFSQLCADSQCSTAAPAAVPQSDMSRVKVEIQRGLHDALSAGH